MIYTEKAGNKALSDAQGVDSLKGYRDGQRNFTDEMPRSVERTLLGH